MIQDATECFEADLPFADVLVPIDAGAERGLGVIYVNDKDAVEPNDSIDIEHGAGEALLGVDIPARSKYMRGVDANTDGKVAAEIEN